MKDFDIKFVILIAFLLGLLSGICITCLCKNKISFRKMLGNIASFLQNNWYIVILITSISYVVIKYPDCADFTLFSNFNGDNLVFVLCLIILILPLFDKFELFGVNLILRRQNEKSDEAAEEAMNNEIPKKDEFLKELTSKRKGENNE
ncbi:MAG: hypothetical protein IKV46_06205 [Bacteroidales bacterium]|nr:hypothetical protein [Bacteroidales bacterium]